MAQFQFEEKEFVRACMALRKKRMIISCLLLILALGLFGTSRMLNAIPEEKLNAFLPFLAGMIAVPLFSIFVNRWQIRKSFRQSEAAQEHMELTFDEEAVHYSHETGEHKLPWVRVKKWQETPDFFLLYESDSFARILPRRALSDEEESILRSQTRNVKKL